MSESSGPEKQPAPSTPAPRPVRWWPAWLICLLATGAIIWLRLDPKRHHQGQNLATALVLVITVLLLLLWCLLFSRLKWRLRLSVLGVFVALICLTRVLFRIHGVTGDLVPILEWRWIRASPAALIPASQLAFSTPKADRAPGTDDYPQFLGPHRDGTLEKPRLARDWKAQPPQQQWRQPIGPGWSGFAVAGTHAITQEQQGDQEAVVCYDLRSGSAIWAYTYPAHFQSTLAGEGPRATPTIAGSRVFSLGSTGILTCLDLETGKAIWSKNIVEDNHSSVDEWGISCSPLVVGDRVVVSAGGSADRSLVAYAASTGAFVWGGGTDGAGYSSPLATTLAGVQQILIFNSGGVCAHALESGKLLWKYRWPGGHPHVSDPVILPNDQVVVSSGYGVGSALITITKDAEGKFAATQVWKSNRLKAKFTNLVYRGGFIYGLDDGILVCLDAANGELKWKGERYGHGQEILVGDLLLVTAESGEVVLLDPNPREPLELTRFSALKGKTWNPPALAGEYLLVRNDKEAACYRLPVVK